MRIRATGFSLVELMVVLMIVGVLALFAYPAYNKRVMETYRKEVVGQMLDLAAHVERLKSQSFSYVGANGETRDTPRYDLSIVSTATTYTVTATPKTLQSDDRCGTMTYSHEGEWSFAGTLTKTDCID